MSKHTPELQWEVKKHPGLQGFPIIQINPKGGFNEVVATATSLERAELIASAPALLAEVEALKAFKTYVHKRLDDAGIEKSPDGEHSKHGCRIGDRLDIVLVGLNELELIRKELCSMNDQLEAENARLKTSERELYEALKEIVRYHDIYPALEQMANQILSKYEEANKPE